MDHEYSEDHIYVITRRGVRELLDMTKIMTRLNKLINRQPKIHHINVHKLLLEVSGKLKNNITTYEIDEYIANYSASASIVNPHYMKLASRLVVDNHQRNTLKSFFDKTKKFYNREDSKGVIHSLVSKEFYDYVDEHQDSIESMIDYGRDFLIDFFGMRTFQKIYGFKINDKTEERPQDMFMRVAVSIYMNSSSDINEELKNIKKCYDLMSTKEITHATPTYFNAGTNYQQFSSCFLLGTNDSIEGIMNTALESSQISKYGGGIGLSIHCWRSNGSLIRKTNGKSGGIIPFLKIYNATMRAFNQGGKRKGSAAVYLSMHHPDIISFLKLRLPQGDEDERARDLFYAVWISDLFMERVKNNEMWSLFDPDTTENLSLYYGDKYKERYLDLEEKKKWSNRINARELWSMIHNSKQLTGLPYICFSDTANNHNQQSNLGTLQCSNLCSEIYEYSDFEQTAVCNLASINLAACVLDSDQKNPNHEFPNQPYFDFKKLINNVKLLVINLNLIIDKNFYPTIKCKKSNLCHRPIGIGVQGLADAYLKMRIPFESSDASKLNKKIFETIYYAALSQSTRLCREKYLMYKDMIEKNGEISLAVYNDKLEENVVTYNSVNNLPKNIGEYFSSRWNGGSPISKGIFHWELYDIKEEDLCGCYDWDTLKKHIISYGVRNSLLIALMPTATTSQLLGNNECFEPYTSNIYKRTTLVGEFIVINKYLINDLYNMNFWKDELKDSILHAEGSIQHIDGLCEQFKSLYKTAFEIDQSIIIQQAIDRQPFVDQGQSLNLFVRDLQFATFNKLIFQAWNKGKGVKTGNYYMRTETYVRPQKFTIDPNVQKKIMESMNQSEQTNQNKPKEEDQYCDLCSS